LAPEADEALAKLMEEPASEVAEEDEPWMELSAEAAACSDERKEPPWARPYQGRSAAAAGTRVQFSPLLVSELRARPVGIVNWASSPL